MPEKFLHHFDVSSNELQQSRIREPECVPPNSLLQFGFPRGGADVVSHDCLGPQRVPTLGLRTNKDPVFSFAIRRLSPPHEQRVGQRAVKRHGLCEASVLQMPTSWLTIERVTLICSAAKSTSLHFRAKSSLRLKPVPRAISTIVRSLTARTDNSRCAPSTVSTSGILRRLALWRTSVMGLWSNRSYRQAWLNRMLKILRIFAELDFASDRPLSHVSTSIVLISWSLYFPQCGTIQFFK